MTTRQHLGLWALMLSAGVSVACGVDNQGLRSTDAPSCQPQPIYMYVYFDKADGGEGPGWVRRAPDGTPNGKALTADQENTINSSTNAGCLTPAGNAIPIGDGGF